MNHYLLVLLMTALAKSVEQLLIFLRLSFSLFKILWKFLIFIEMLWQFNRRDKISLYWKLSLSFSSSWLHEDNSKGLAISFCCRAKSENMVPLEVLSFFPFFVKPSILYIKIISYFNNHYITFLESISFWWICQKASVYKFLELDLATKNLCLTQTRVKGRGVNKTRVPFFKKGGDFKSFSLLFF